jgi:hypothetical protein
MKQGHVLIGQITGLRVFSVPEFGTRASFKLECSGPCSVACCIAGDVAREFLRTGLVHPHRRLCPRGQHGGCLFHGAWAERFLPIAQWRGVGNRLLFRLSLSLGRRRGRMEPRSTTRTRIRLIAKPGLAPSLPAARGAGCWAQRRCVQYGLVTKKYKPP